MERLSCGGFVLVSIIWVIITLVVYLVRVLLAHKPLRYIVSSFADEEGFDHGSGCHRCEGVE